MDHDLPVLANVGGLVEQSMIKSECVSSEIALHREAAVVSCWERPCKLAALMNLVHYTTETDKHVAINLHAKIQQAGGRLRVRGIGHVTVWLQLTLTHQPSSSRLN